MYVLKKGGDLFVINFKVFLVLLLQILFMIYFKYMS